MGDDIETGKREDFETQIVARLRSVARCERAGTNYTIQNTISYADLKREM